MPVGIDLRLTPGPGGRPDALLLADVQRECPLCGFVEARRIFTSTPLHPLNLRRLALLAPHIGKDYTFDCPQCEEPVRHADTRRAALHYGFPADDAVLTAFPGRSPGDPILWALQPRRRLDVQMLPRWEVDDNVHDHTTTRPTEAWVREVAGRPLSAKAAVRELLAASEPSAEARAHALAPGLAVVLAPAECAEGDARAALAALGGLTSSWVLRQAAAAGAPVAGGFGAPSGWLADAPGLEGQSVWLAASPGEVLHALEHILGGLPLGARLVPTATSSVQVELPGPHTDHPVLDPVRVAEEAAATGLVPGDAARLELDRLLLWQLVPELAAEGA